MTPETLTALKASIAHHEENLKAETPAEVKLSASHCALCVMFLRGDYGGWSCGGCPVEAKTMRRLCYDTPFRQLETALYRWEREGSEESKSAFLTAERAEIAFLRSLLPEEKV